MIHFDRHTSQRVLAGNQKETTISSGYMNYPNKVGGFNRIKRDIVFSNSQDYPYKVTKAEIKVAFPEMSSLPIRVTDDNDVSTLLRLKGLYYYNNSDSSYISIGTLKAEPVILVSENALMYEDILAGVDLCYTHTGVSVKQEVILSEAFRDSLNSPYNNCSICLITEIDSDDRLLFVDNEVIADRVLPRGLLRLTKGLAYVDTESWNMKSVYRVVDGRSLIFTYIDINIVKDIVNFPGDFILDPSTTIDVASAGTAQIRYSGTVSFSDSRNRTSGNVIAGDGFLFGLRRSDPSGSWDVDRYFSRFDLTSIDGSDSVTSVTVKVYPVVPVPIVHWTYDIHEGSQGSSAEVADFNAFPGWVSSGAYSLTGFLSTKFNTATYNLNTYNSKTMNSTGKSYIEGKFGSYAELVFLSDPDVANTEPGLVDNRQNHQGRSAANPLQLVIVHSSTGYAHTVMGVASANIGSVNGVATANISTVNGV